MAGVVALRGLRRLIGLYNITRLVLRRIMAGVCEFRRGALTLAVSSGPGLVIRKPGGLRMTGPIHRKLAACRVRDAAWNRGLHLHVDCARRSRGVCAVQSQIENYRAKVKEFARLTVVAKSLRHSRQYRKPAEMYWALALGEEPDRAQPSKANVKRNTT